MKCNTSWKSATSVFLLTLNLNAFQSSDRSIRPSLALGIGYPKISLSQFRPPVSVVSNIGLHWAPLNKWAFEATGYGLKTYSLGTVTGQKAKLQFDLWWAGFDLQYKLHSGFDNANYVCAGIGQYHLNRTLDKEIDQVNTPGFCLGYVTHFSHLRRSSALEVRWHLLFEPDDQPQVLTITFGILL